MLDGAYLEECRLRPNLSERSVQQLGGVRSSFRTRDVQLDHSSVRNRKIVVEETHPEQVALPSLTYYMLLRASRRYPS
jgi:hypothetical protein